MAVCTIAAPARRPAKRGIAITNERVSLSEVRDLLRVDEALPFRVLDAQGRLLLAQGRALLGADQLEMLIERGAWAERDHVVAARQKHVAAGSAAAVASTRRRTLFDTWEHRVWELDALLRKLGPHEGVARELETFCGHQLALIERDPDVALFMALRQDDQRLALYAVKGQAAPHCGS